MPLCPPFTSSLYPGSLYIGYLLMNGCWNRGRLVLIFFYCLCFSVSRGDREQRDTGKQAPSLIKPGSEKWKCSTLGFCASPALSFDWVSLPHTQSLLFPFPPPSSGSSISKRSGKYIQSNLYIFDKDSCVGPPWVLRNLSRRQSLQAKHYIS